MNKAQALAILATVAILMLTIVGLLKPAMSQSESTWVGGTIYIRADGSIEPSNAPIISSDNRTYIITSNIKIVYGNGIVIERDNIILEGGGHTIQGAACCYGILLTNRVNISIKNLVITNFTYGVYLETCSGTTIENNTISNNSWYGIYMYSSSSNFIVSNTISNNSWYGIYMYSSSNNTIENNTISNSGAGIHMYYSGNNEIKGNSFIYCGLSVIYSYENIVINNTVNGRPLVYLEKVSGVEVTGEVGQVIVVRSENITIRNLDISNASIGIELLESKNIHIINNTISNNRWYGIVMGYSSNNEIRNNTISNNSWAGIYMDSSSNNTI
ncbi:MAG: NosD domain-containing protein, partial [Thermosphaera sp.]